MHISKIGRRGQIAIPSKIRQELHLQEGDRLAFVWRDNKVVLQPLRQSLRDLRGTVLVEKPQDFEAIRALVNF
ncbi:SpoVT-AbrB domain-containing protein [Tumidithrix helvetica PCC 7403]|uniref:AbrB/MazE/SpoVT family DNA-binding domain-containing protein n=1 Tax=Tumidithrix helvetica TaxID=3457545 RepID=UPI003C80DEE2